MWRVEQVLQKIVGFLSRLLDPVVAVVEWVDLSATSKLERAGVREVWAERLVGVAWLVVVLLGVRVLQGWWRVLALAVILLVLGRIYGFVPRATN